MIEWTESAKRALDAYCARSKAVLAGSGADADEVSDDLRRHVEEEVAAARLSVVTEEDVRRILARVGEPGPAAVGTTCVAEAPAPAPVHPEKMRPGFWILLFTVILPAITIGFELATAMSSAVLFDPFPTWLNVAMVILVPVVNFWMWRAARARDSRHAKVLGWLNGVACGVAVFYAILYLPFIPFAGVALIFFGAGLIALAPLFACITTPWLRSIYQKRVADTRLPGGLPGAAAGMMILVVLQLPTAVTYYGLARAASDDPATRNHGANVLRNFGNTDLILRASYGFLRREPELDLVRWIATGGENIGSEQARETYYRVTGNPFNSVPPPTYYTRAGRWRMLEEDFTWDDARGGDVVAGQIKGLSLMSSRMDALAEPDAAIVYCEWTLEFKNVSARPREARAQVALPPGGVVSRVTLWINGEEREAAFGGRSQVREAYKEVAVVQQRDPILVTTCGPDRVLVQCFPVPRNGGVMKVKLGVTTPLLLNSAERGQFIWPRFLERNFAIAADLKHSLWIESSGAMSNDKGEAAKPAHGGKAFAFLQAASETEFAGKTAAVIVQRAPEIKEVWTPAEESGQYIRQTLQMGSAKPIKRLILVLDGSNGLQPVAREVTEALSPVADNMQISVLLAADSVVNLTGNPPKPAKEAVKELRERLSRVSFRGGQDNVPAVEAAWDLASAADDGAVLWIHGPEPVLLSPESGLRQRLERNSTGTRLFELQTRTGPDRIVEKLDGLPSVQHVPRLGSVGADLLRVLSELGGRTPRFEFLRERVASGVGTVGGPQVSRHLLRLWARDEALRLASARKEAEATALAVRNQLVTPLTGAVVLETKVQYDRHGLKAADPMNVPAVPEPQIGVLLAAAFILARLRYTRRRLGTDGVFRR